MGNRRRRRSNNEGQSADPAEDHVELDLVHPCFYVDQHTTEYCVNENTCWTLQQCIDTFPNDDFTNSDLDQIMEEFKNALEEHINQITSTTEAPVNAHDQILESIRENASKVLETKQTFDDAIDQIIQSINNL